jgi:hypothetical protein
MICPDPINPKFEFSLNEFDKDKFNSLPEFIRKMIESSKEYKALFSENKDVKQSEAEIDTNGIHLNDEGMPF